MIAAIYARKSTEQAGVADDQKSVAVQIAHARAFAAEKGYTVPDELIFVDDGISGAIFGDGRPGLMRLMNALKPRPAFGALFMTEESRLGREQLEVGYLLKTIISAGVDVWLSHDRRQRKLDTPIEKIMLSLSTFSDEVERANARTRTREKMLTKARAGHVTGGACFGYTNVEITRPDGARSHVERQINDREAAVIRRIFELAALGHGLRAIAHAINAERLPSPRPQRGRPAGWAPSTIRDVLNRSIYRGVITYDRARRDNERKQLRRHANATPITVDAPALRIVSEDLAAAVDAQRSDRRERYLRKTDGKLLGRPAPKAIKHVLTGLLRCACGATFEAQRGFKHSRGTDGHVYVCSAARRKGKAICASDVHVLAPDAEAEILGAVERQLLAADVLGPALDLAVERLSREAPDRAAQHAERAQLGRELANLIALAKKGTSPTIFAEITTCEQRKATLDRALDAPVIDREGLRRALDAKIADWQGLLHGAPTHAQTVLRTLLGADGIRVGQPQGGFVTWEAGANAEEMLGGLLVRVGGVPSGIRTRVLALKGPRPGPLDDGDSREVPYVSGQDRNT